MALDHFHWTKVFGVGLDASDDPWTLQLKLASIHARETGVNGLYADPYEAIAPELVRLNQQVEPIGKFPIPSWLSPRPRPSDGHLVTKENMEGYVAGGGMLELSRQLKGFVQKNVFPGQPIMLGVDHSATGGVVSALSDKLGPENLSVLVLDQHFDGLPLSIRMEAQMMANLGCPTSGAGPLPDVKDGNEYCCGNFWKHLIDSGIILPGNLLFVGVADYPGEQVIPGWERFRKNYLDLEAWGCNFFPLKEFKGHYVNRLKRFIEDKIAAPNVYVSLDLDVGAYRCIHAARYMDSVGIERKALMDVARIIADRCRSGKFRLAGMDVMEFNIHFLGLEIGPGTKDDTISVALDFINEMLSGQREVQAAKGIGAGRRRGLTRIKRSIK